MLAFAARAFAWFSSWWEKPLRIGTNVIVGRHAHAVDVLARDLEFRIGRSTLPRSRPSTAHSFSDLIAAQPWCASAAALYRALAKVDLRSLRGPVENEAISRIAKAGEEIDAVSGFARPIAAQTAQSLFGISGMNPTLFMDVSRALFAHIFLNLNDDEEIKARAMLAAPYLKEWLCDEIKKRREPGYGFPDKPDMMDALLQDAEIPDDPGGDDLVRRTLGGMLVGSIDTTATCVAKIHDAGTGQDLGSGHRRRCRQFSTIAWLVLGGVAAVAAQSAGVAQRRHRYEIAGMEVRANDHVFVYTQAAMLDTSVFPEPQMLDPARPLRPYLHFGGGLHPCAGRDVNAFNPMLVGALVRRGIKSVGTLDWAGPFPDRLPVTFNRAGP